MGCVGWVAVALSSAQYASAVRYVNPPEIKYIDIADEPEYQKKYEIVVVPTIIIFKDGEEIKRFQADISFSMKATRKEIQGTIDDIIMSDF